MFDGFYIGFLVALWFACQKPENNEDTDGKVFILNCYDTEKFSRVSPKVIGEKIDHFLDENFPTLWYWIPEKLNQRLTDQDAVFIFGEPRINRGNYKEIEIKKDDKKPVLQELEKFFDYTRETLFADKYAIGDNYKNIDISSPEYTLKNAVYYIQTKESENAKPLLEKIIKDNPENKSLKLEAHFQQLRLMLNEKRKIMEDKEQKNTEELFDDPKYKEHRDHCIKQKYKKVNIEKLEHKFRETIDKIPEEQKDGVER